MRELPWEVVPGVGVGPLRFGTPREELHRTLGSYSAFRRGGHTRDLTDQYDDGLLMLTCSAGEGLYLVEIPDPDGVHYRGVELAGSVGEVLTRLRAAGIEPVSADSGWNLADGTVSLYTPSSAPDATVDAVTVFGPGHEMRGEIVFFPAGPEAVPVTRRRTVLPGRGVGSVEFGQSRDEVRRRHNGGLCWSHPAGSREPVQDDLVEDGLVVTYGSDLRVVEIIVTRADEVMFGDVNLMSGYPRTVDEVRAALVAAGHRVTESEAAVELVGTGVQVWTARADAGKPLPVSSVLMNSI